MFYLGKFFWWEHGYWNSMDIQHDRAGFYICWGCLVWVPTVYCSPGYFYANRTVDLVSSPTVALIIAAVGMMLVWLNYEADRQRMHARQTKGRGSAWGSPYQCLEAEYVAKLSRVAHGLDRSPPTIVLPMSFAPIGHDDDDMSDNWLLAQVHDGGRVASQ